MGLPSKGTPLYCLMAFKASERLSKTTSAVPANKDYNENVTLRFTL